MYLTLRSPKGQTSSYDLLQWVAWSLELAQVNLKGSPDTVGIALVLRGPLNGMAMSINLTVIDLGRTIQDVPEAASVVAVGFPEKSVAANKTRLMEAFGVFTNGEKYKGEELAKLLEGGGKLAESYHAFLRCICGGAPGDSIHSPGVYGHFEHAGYRWVLSTTRFPNLAALDGVASAPVGGFTPPAADPHADERKTGGKGKQRATKAIDVPADPPADPGAGALSLPPPPVDDAAGGLGKPPGGPEAETKF